VADHLLTFEIEPEQVTIHTDPDGLRHLIGRLQRLLAAAEQNGNEHEHLMTPEWSGTDLTSEQQDGGEVVNHVQVFCWVTPHDRHA